MILILLIEYLQILINQNMDYSANYSMARGS